MEDLNVGGCDLFAWRSPVQQQDHGHCIPLAPRRGQEVGDASVALDPETKRLRRGTIGGGWS